MNRLPICAMLICTLLVLTLCSCQPELPSPPSDRKLRSSIKITRSFL